jgi:hypothetical protein
MKYIYNLLTSRACHFEQDTGSKNTTKQPAELINQFTSQCTNFIVLDWPTEWPHNKLPISFPDRLPRAFRDMLNSGPQRIFESLHNFCTTQNVSDEEHRIYFPSSANTLVKSVSITDESAITQASIHFLGLNGLTFTFRKFLQETYSSENDEIILSHLLQRSFQIDRLETWMPGKTTSGIVDGVSTTLPDIVSTFDLATSANSHSEKLPFLRAECKRDLILEDLLSLILRKADSFKPTGLSRINQRILVEVSLAVLPQMPSYLFPSTGVTSLRPPSISTPVCHRPKKTTLFGLLSAISSLRVLSS